MDPGPLEAAWAGNSSQCRPRQQASVAETNPTPSARFFFFLSSGSPVCGPRRCPETYRDPFLTPFSRMDWVVASSISRQPSPADWPQPWDATFWEALQAHFSDASNGTHRPRAFQVGERPPSHSGAQTTFRELHRKTTEMSDEQRATF